MEWKNKIGILSLISVTIIFLVILLVLGTGNLILGDEKLFMVLNPGQGNPTPFDGFFVLFSTWGPGDFGLGTYIFIPFALVLVFLSLKVKTLRPMRFMLILVIIGLIVGYLGITTVLKYVIGRARPFLDPSLLSNAGDLFSNPLIMFDDPCLPSGHATTGFIFATPFMLLYKNRGIQLSALIYGVLTAYARIFIGVHFPLDVFVGSLIGIFTVGVFYILLKRYFLPKFPWFQYEELEGSVKEKEVK